MPAGSARGIEDPLDVREVAMRVLARRPHVDLGGGDGLLLDALHLQHDTGQAERVDALLEGLDRNAEIDERTEQHVAARAANGIDLADATHYVSCTALS